MSELKQAQASEVVVFLLTDIFSWKQHFSYHESDINKRSQL